MILLLFLNVPFAPKTISSQCDIWPMPLFQVTKLTYLMFIHLLPRLTRRWQRKHLPFTCEYGNMSFLKWDNPGLFFVCFRSFQTNIITIFTANICEKMSIQHTDSNPRPDPHPQQTFGLATTSYATKSV